MSPAERRTPSFRITHGLHRGRRAADLSFEELIRAVKDCPAATAEWHALVGEIVARGRQQEGSTRRQRLRAPSTPEEREAAKARRADRAAWKAQALTLVQLGYRELAKRYHPDKGGSAEAMVRLIRVRDGLVRGAMTVAGRASEPR